MATNHNSKTALFNQELGIRENAGKLRWSLVDFDALEPMVRVLEFGANKYADHNWKKGQKTTELTESLMRHLTAYLKGEDNDPESGLPHVGHIMCNAMFLSYMHKYKKSMDTRFRDPAKQECCGQWDENGVCTCNQQK